MTKRITKLKQILEDFRHRPQKGENKQLFHHASSEGNIEKFQPFSHFGTANAARAVAFDRNRTGRNAEVKHTYTTRLKLGKTVHVGDDTGDHHPIGVFQSLKHGGHLPKMTNKEYDSHINHMTNLTIRHVGGSGHDQSKQRDDERELGNYAANVIRKHGIRSISYNNAHEDPGSKSYIITHPNQVRIVHKGSRIDSTNRGRKNLRGLDKKGNLLKAGVLEGLLEAIRHRPQEGEVNNV